VARAVQFSSLRHGRLNRSPVFDDNAAGNSVSKIILCEYNHGRIKGKLKLDRIFYLKTFIGKNSFSETCPHAPPADRR